MTLFDPYALTPTGDPVGPTPPPELRVIGGQATPAQRQMAQQAFVQFCTRARLSVVPNPRETGRLPDGSRYEIVVVGKAKTMLLWPVGSGGGAFIAWTAFFNSSHLPIWERPLVDFPYDDLPPKPESPGPEPEYPPLAETGLIPETETPSEGVTIQRFTAFASVPGLGRIFESTVEGRFIVTPAECGSVRTQSDEFPFLDTYAVGGDSVSEVFTYTYDVKPIFEIVSVTGGIEVKHLADHCNSESPLLTLFVPRVNTGIRLGAGMAASSYNVAAIAAWNAAHAAWEAAQGAYLAALAEWTEQREALLALQRPWFPVQDARNAARPSQVAAVKDHLMGGIGDRHLTARILSFPYNVAYRSIPAPGAGGTITNEAVSTSTLLSFRTTLTNAQPFTTIPRWDDGDNEMYPERLLRVDFMPPENLFGWTANGSAQYGYRFHLENPRTEHYVLMPPGLSGITATVPDDYFDSTRIVSDSSPGLVVSSDAFVPVGSTVTVVLFEYRVADPYTGAMYWTGCPDLMLHDSIWIRDAGVYIDVPRVVDELFTERVRIAGVITQKRTAWGTWSAPLETPRAKLVQGGWDARYVAAVEYVRPAKAPAAVVIVENLAAGANPASTQVGTFHMNATFLWNGDAQAITKAKGAPWVADASLAPQKQFIVRALIATGKIKP
ncbi:MULTISPECIES: hypothetical protein [unclassified Acidovorax]|uniref:hypothetical protein n=1 Tax=unclassified Acidovorax TaxID=2684926 RepID=UPI001C446BBA|nr:MULTISPECIES: hypothetical protein [unclassified Acidovorax]MBV7460632.1 hypothetical protein [Acidovorax sp. sif0632]MBV7465657.1 hypothetical protein [Acidovorax sp. sif0613]